MNRILLTTALVAAVLSLSISPAAPRRAGGPLALRPNQAQALTSIAAWNLCCDAWEFAPVPYYDPAATFESVWMLHVGHELTYSQAIAGITADMNELLNTNVPDPTGDDSYNITIDGWGGMGSTQGGH